MIQSSACQPWRVDLPGLAGEYGGLVGSYTISWDTIDGSGLSRFIKAATSHNRIGRKLFTNALREEHTWECEPCLVAYCAVFTPFSMNHTTGIRCRPVQPTTD